MSNGNASGYSDFSDSSFIHSSGSNNSLKTAEIRNIEIPKLPLIGNASFKTQKIVGYALSGIAVFVSMFLTQGLVSNIKQKNLYLNTFISVEKVLEDQSILNNNLVDTKYQPLLFSMSKKAESVLASINSEDLNFSEDLKVAFSKIFDDLNKSISNKGLYFYLNQLNTTSNQINDFNNSMSLYIEKELVKTRDFNLSNALHNANSKLLKINANIQLYLQNVDSSNRNDYVNKVREGIKELLATSKGIGGNLDALLKEKVSLYNEYLSTIRYLETSRSIETELKQDINLLNELMLNERGKIDTNYYLDIVLKIFLIALLLLGSSYFLHTIFKNEVILKQVLAESELNVIEKDLQTAEVHLEEFLKDKRVRIQSNSTGTLMRSHYENINRLFQSLHVENDLIINNLTKAEGVNENIDQELLNLEVKIENIMTEEREGEKHINNIFKHYSKLVALAEEVKKNSTKIFRKDRDVVEYLENLAKITNAIEDTSSRTSERIKNIEKHSTSLNSVSEDAITLYQKLYVHSSNLEIFASKTNVQDKNVLMEIIRDIKEQAEKAAVLSRNTRSTIVSAFSNINGMKEDLEILKDKSVNINTSTFDILETFNNVSTVDESQREKIMALMDNVDSEVENLAKLKEKTNNVLNIAKDFKKVEDLSKLNRTQKDTFEKTKDILSVKGV